MTRAIMAAIRKKKKLWEEAKAGGSMDAYKAEDKKVRKLIRNAKRNLEKKLADGTDGNNRPFFAYVKKRTKVKPTIGPLKKPGGEPVTGYREMAELLNEYFSLVFTREDTDNVPAAARKDNIEPLTGIRLTSGKCEKRSKSYERRRRRDLMRWGRPCYKSWRMNLPGHSQTYSEHRCGLQ
jgi:hypothetical protein